jgi:hypothetical protein
MFVPHGGLLLTQDQVGVYRKTRMLSMVLSLSPPCTRTPHVT